MIPDLAIFWALCGGEGIAPALRTGLPLALLFAGAAGSVMHCVPMCGPFVLGQVADGMANMPGGRMSEFHRRLAGLLLPYHAGRLLTYAALGAGAALTGSVLAALPWFGWSARAFMLLGALLLTLQAMRSLGLRGVFAFARWGGGGAVARRDGGGAASTQPANWWRKPPWRARGCRACPRAGGFSLGLMLGFLPCGFLYGALAVAAGAGSPLLGAVLMLAFGLGTVPGLMVVGLGGRLAAVRWRSAIARFTPFILLLNAAILVLLAAGRP